MNDKLRAAHTRLQQAVAEIASGDDWKLMLQVVSKFHRYSFNNHLMIFIQRPDATVVAGFTRWKSLGRHVKKGLLLCGSSCQAGSARCHGNRLGQRELFQAEAPVGSLSHLRR